MKKKEKFVIKSGHKLYGEIRNQTSKNATLPIMSACVLAEGVCRINEIPRITDVDNMIKILKHMGAKVDRIDNDCTIDTSKIKKYDIDCRLSKTMRSSIFLLGSVLARFKSALISMPGGCDIGKRPIDIHIDAMKRLGVKVESMGDNLFFDASKARPNKIKLKIPSVGATENIVLFASKLKGKTTIINPAREPEVVDLCNFLNQMGATILGAGTKKITIFGCDKLNGVEYRPIGDRIVAGTLMTAVAICGGAVKITNAQPYQNLKLIEILSRMGCQIDIKNDIINISRETLLENIHSISTGYYPDFPTDMQSMLLTLSCVARGQTTIYENVFENRFLTVPELYKLGARIKIIDSHTVKVRGADRLVGNTLVSKDLRGGASLVLAGLVAEGETVVEDIHFIDRGYDHLEDMLSRLGADIKRI
ncbi:MAG: UDP-N-acetylglucosamine 1-carboxyvinyltransferase [Clostridiales bacterium]|nr:UDP-N-acetylglucosamine 1-carboxyvinyltransferase [Clostridiales bacterium]